MTGLDPVRRRDLMTLIRTSARLSGVPVILITHQIEEMLFAADDAVLMAPARTVTSGPIETVLAHAETARLLNIDDAGSLIEATVGGRQDGLISCCNGNTSLMLPDDGEPEGCRLRLRVLGRDVALSKHALEDVSILNQIECRIAGVTERPSGYDIALETADGVQLKSRITMRSYKALNLKEGDTVFALIKAVAVKEMLVEG
ncbi:TOBE domain-containing protein [Kordiimonas marina]|uniref:TOBE domain-containing protein n=1 Tax=Kordiimonas marina TaxID=2872312 RepID=UPI003CCFE09F